MASLDLLREVEKLEKLIPELRKVAEGQCSALDYSRMRGRVRNSADDIDGILNRLSPAIAR